MEATYILTAEFDSDSFVWLDGLRREHFPAERNFLPAHLTLFHRLSHEQVVRLSSLDVPDDAIRVRFNQVVFLGFGVAFNVQSSALERLRREIRTGVGGAFSPQDSQPWLPHVTIQNKVGAESARELHRQLKAEFAERTGAVTGLLVWEYLGGPWSLVRRIAFGR